MRRRVLEPWSFLAIAPNGEQLAQPCEAKLLIAQLEAFLLQRQGRVKHEAAHAGELPQLTLLLASWLDSVLEGLAFDHWMTVYIYSTIGKDGYVLRAILPRRERRGLSNPGENLVERIDIGEDQLRALARKFLAGAGITIPEEPKVVPLHKAGQSRQRYEQHELL